MDTSLTHPLAPLEEFVAPLPMTAIDFNDLKGKVPPVFLSNTVEAEPIVRMRLQEEKLTYAFRYEGVKSLGVVGLNIDMGTGSGLPRVEIHSGETRILLQ